MKKQIAPYTIGLFFSLFMLGVALVYFMSEPIEPINNSEEIFVTTISSITAKTTDTSESFTSDTTTWTETTEITTLQETTSTNTELVTSTVVNTTN